MTSTPAHRPDSVAPTHPAHVLLARAHSPPTASELFTTKIKQKPLFLHATSPPSASDNRRLRRHIRLRKKAYFLRKQKPQPLSAKEKRVLGIYKLKKEECKYAIYEGLHRMWVGYMQEVLSLRPYRDGNNAVTASIHGSLLASADYHGAELEVAQSGCVDRVGLKGIVVRDTKFTFVIVTSKDEVKSAFCPPQQRSFRRPYLPSCLSHVLTHYQRFPRRTPFSDSRYHFPAIPTSRSTGWMRISNLLRPETLFSSSTAASSSFDPPTAPTGSSS
jgi:ribonuclease P protein subunit POP4